jgi:branched-chain amino acid transport system substrate-binding protein
LIDRKIERRFNMKWMRLLVLRVLLVSFASTLIIGLVNSAEAANAKIVMGLVEATSGPFKSSGERFVIGAKYAIDEINAKGGLLGKHVVLVVEDGAFKPDVTSRKATKLVLEDEADFLLGSIGSQTAMALMKVAAKYKKIHLIYNATADSITGSEFSPYSFRTTICTAQRANALMSYFAKYTNYKKFYILCTDVSAGHEVGEGYKKNLKKILDGQIVGEDYHPVGLKDFAPYVSKVIASGAEVVLTGNYGPDLSNLIKTGADLGWKAITGGGYLFDPYIMQDVKGAALGHVVVEHTLIDMSNPVQRKFIQDFKEKNKDLDPVVYSPVFGVNDIYWGAQWLFDVVKKAGSTDSERIIKAWEGATYNMPWGKVTMRPCDHQVITPVRAAVMVKENDFFPFPYTGKPVVIPEEAVTVPLAETGNQRCK